LIIRLDLIDYTSEFKNAMRNWDLGKNPRLSEEDNRREIEKVEAEIRGRLTYNDEVLAIHISESSEIGGVSFSSSWYRLYCKIAYISDEFPILYFREWSGRTKLSWITSSNRLIELREIKGTPLKLEEWYKKLASKSFW